MHRIAASRWFALEDLFIALACAAIWIIGPTGTAWIALLPLVPSGATIAVGLSVFRGTLFDLLIAMLLTTGQVEYWCSNIAGGIGQI